MPSDGAAARRQSFALGRAMAKGDATDRRAAAKGVGSQDKAQLASWAAAATSSRRKLIEKALPGGKAQIGACGLLVFLGEGEFALYACVKSGEGTGAKVACRPSRRASRARARRLYSQSETQTESGLEVEAMNRLRHEGVCRLYEVVNHQLCHCFIEAGERDLFSFLDGHPRGCRLLWSQ